MTPKEFLEKYGTDAVPVVLRVVAKHLSEEKGKVLKDIADDLQAMLKHLKTNV